MCNTKLPPAARTSAARVPEAARVIGALTVALALVLALGLALRTEAHAAALPNASPNPDPLRFALSVLEGDPDQPIISGRFYVPGEPLRVRVAVGLDDLAHPDVSAGGVLTHWPGPLTATFRLSFQRIAWTYPGSAAAAMQEEEPAPVGEPWHSPRTTLELTPGITTVTELDLNPFFGETPVDLDKEEGIEIFAQYCLGNAKDECAPGEQIRNTARLRLRRFTQDLGDAPDSTNHFALAMPAYAGTQGNFPTVYDPATGADRGPRHVHPRPFHLGDLVSWEGEADIGLDQDPTNNLEPAAPGGGQANLDRHDDGANPPVWTLDNCRRTQVPVRVFIAPSAVTWFQQADAKGYVNIWLDANRDGDWADSVQCPATENQPPVALEHVVIDHPVDVVGLGPGLHTILVNTGRVPWPETDRPAWVRVTLSERPSNKPLTTAGIAHGDGQSHAAPFRLGETEDYLWRSGDNPGGIDVAVRKRGRVFQEFDEQAGQVVSRIAWVIEYGNRGDRTATGVTLVDQLEDGQNIIAILIGLFMPDGVQRENDGDKIVFKLGDLDPGERGRILIVTQVTQPLAELGTVVNRAGIQAEGDVYSDNNTDRARVQVGLAAPRILTPVDGTTCRGDVDVAGRAERNATVELYVDGALAQTVTANAQGRWQATVTGLADGRHTLAAVAKIGSATSPRSAVVELYVDPSLLWDPISLRFIDPRGHVRQPADEDGRLDADGWSIHLRPNTTYTVEVGVCCDASAQVTLTVANLGEFPLTDPDGDKTYSGSFTTGPRNTTPGALTLTVVCGDVTSDGSGEVVLIDPAGTVYDLGTQQPLAGATVACMESQTAAAGSAAAFSLWDAGAFGQVNPQQTPADGGFSFLTPVGAYRLDVNHPSYQPYRSPALVVENDPVFYNVGLTPRIEAPADYRVTITESGFEPPLLNVPVGAIVEWINLDAQDHSATLLPDGGAAQTAATAAWDSGALAPGASYKVQVRAAGSFTYGDRFVAENAGTLVVQAAAAAQNYLYLPAVDQ